MKTLKKFIRMIEMKRIMIPLISLVLVVTISCNENAKKAGETMETNALSSVPPPPQYTIESGDTIWYVVDQLPVFKGGDAALLQFIVENTKYPENARTKGLEGRVIVVFEVAEDGTVTNAKVDQSVDPEIDAEALRVVSSLPVFEKPAFRKGKEVPVWYAVPISFKLK